MKTPAILLLFSIVLCFLGFSFPAWSDLLLLAVPMALASVILLAFFWGRSRAANAQQKPKPIKHNRPNRPKRPKKTRARPKGKKTKWVIVDGSNVMYWRDGKPSIEPVREVLAILDKHGFTAGVMFDSNAGYLLNDNYQQDHVFSKQLGLPEERIMVVPSGTPADPYILAAAMDFDAKIVTNDRFRDWADEYPEVTEPGFLVTGQYRKGNLIMSLA